MTGKNKVRAVIETLDRRIAEQIAPILDHPELRRLRRAWHGLHYLVRTLPTGEMLKVRVADVTREEMRAEFDEFRGEHWRRSFFYRQFHDMVYGGFGGEPFGLLVLDGEVDDGPVDTVLLDDLDRIAREAHAPLVVAAAEGAEPEGRDHVHLTRPGSDRPHSSAWSRSSCVGNAYDRCGWFSELESGEEHEDGSRFLTLLTAELFARHAKWVAKMGRAYEREDVERELADWLAGYVADGEPTVERPLVGAGVTVHYDLDHERDLVFRLRLEAAWKLTPLAGGLEVVGRIER